MNMSVGAGESGNHGFIFGAVGLLASTLGDELMASRADIATPRAIAKMHGVNSPLNCTGSTSE